MTDASVPEKGLSRKAKTPAGKRGAGLQRPETTRTPRVNDEPTGWGKVMGILLDIDRRGEAGRIIERWPVTSLTEMRDAIDAAIEIVTEAGGPAIILEPVTIELAHYPRAEGKPYRLSIDQPVGSVGGA